METVGADSKGAAFFARFSTSRPRALLLDYDGTLAPFQIERNSARPYPAVRAALQALTLAGRTRVVIISGRAIRDLLPLLGLDPPPELWGCHGWERLAPDGRYDGPQLDHSTVEALAEAKRRAESEGWANRCEIKPASVAIHWRGVDEREAQQIREQARAAWTPLTAPAARVELCDFDGGLELRAAGRDKGYAVRAILEELDERALVAYAGDDLTDEDAFRALGDRGLSILVRDEYRETAAELWLRPPDELVRFLKSWAAADSEGAER